MEEEDDDFYGGAGANAQEYETLPDHGNIEEEQKMDVSAEQDDDEEDSDDVRVLDRIPMQTCIDIFYVGRSIHP